MAKRSKQAGFTLIELMMVVVIVAILAAISIPAYQDYLVRSRIVELMNMALPAKTAVTEWMMTHGGVPPDSNKAAGIDTVKTQYVDTILIGKGGTITITANTKNLGISERFALQLTPLYSKGAIRWQCQAMGAKQYAPASCRE